jgi:hypothetical protein
MEEATAPEEPPALADVFHVQRAPADEPALAPFDSAQGGPFDSAQGRPLDSVQGLSEHSRASGLEEFLNAILRARARRDAFR